MMSFAEIKETKERKNHRSIINIPSYFYSNREVEVLLFHQVLLMDCLRGNYLSSLLQFSGWTVRNTPGNGSEACLLFSAFTNIAWAIFVGVLIFIFFL